MIRNLILIALGALAIAACKKEDSTIVAGERPDPMAAELNKAAPVTLPPSIQASKTYRCKDNSLLYVDWLSDGTARVKTDKAAIAEAAPEGALTGDAKGKSVTYKGQSCNS